MPPAIEVVGLVHRFGKVTALDGLSLSAEAGELFGLVGPDGAGKTTTLRAMAGLIRPTGGHVRILGREATDGRVREDIGYMPERYSLYGDLSVEENLDFFGRIFCLERAAYEARAKRLLALMRLDAYRDRRADALSGGMYKKLALAAAMLHQPRVLLLDEPTNGVDPVSRLDLWGLLHEFVSEGMAVVVATAYMDEAERCHRVAVLHQGRVVLEGRPRELVAGFEDHVLRVEPADARAMEVVSGLGPRVGSCTVRGECLRLIVRAAALGEVTQAIGAAGLTWAVQRPTFEDLFVAREGVGQSWTDVQHHERAGRGN